MYKLGGGGGGGGAENKSNLNWLYINRYCEIIFICMYDMHEYYIYIHIIHATMLSHNQHSTYVNSFISMYNPRCKYVYFVFSVTRYVVIETSLKFAIVFYILAATRSRLNKWNICLW